MRRVGGWTLGVMLAMATLGAADSQTRTTTTTAPGQTTAPANQNRTADFIRLMQQAAEAAARAKAAEAAAAAAKAEADRKAAAAAADAGTRAAQAEADRQAAAAKAEADRLAAAANQAAADKRAAEARAQRAGGRGVDWPAAVAGTRASGGGAATLAPNLDRAAIDRTRMPILLPTDGKLLAAARIYSFGDFYTISGDIAGGGVSLTGSIAAIPLPADRPLKVTPSGPEALTVQRTVDGQLASFVRYGVLYTVEVRCDSAQDPRCVDENYVLGLVGKTTAVVMGKAAREAAGLGG